MSKIATNQVQTGAIDSSAILNGGVAEIDLVDGAVTTPKIADANVTDAKIATVSAVKVVNSVVTANTTPYSVAATDVSVYADSTSGALTLNLPAGSASTGRMLRIIKPLTVENIVSIVPNGTDTISGLTAFYLDRFVSGITLIAHSSGWYAFDKLVSLVESTDAYSTQASTTSKTFTVYRSYTTPILSIGNYEIKLAFSWSCSSASRAIEHRLYSSSAGGALWNQLASTAILATAGSYGTSSFVPFTRATSGTETLTLEHRNVSTSTSTSYMYRSAISIARI